MPKTLGDMAKFLKILIPMDIPETYTFNPIFRDISDEKDIRSGVLAFRNFLYRICDCLITDNSLCAEPQKGKNWFSDETTLGVEFPFINNIRSILINTGYHGILSEKGDSLLVNDWGILSAKKSHNPNSTTKISDPQMIKTMKFFTECGMVFDGIDLSVKKTDVSKVETVKISYPDCPIMLTGLKVLAVAQKELLASKNDDILLRCDYRALKDEDTEIISIMKDFAKPLPATIQEFVLKLHQHFLDSGMKCKLILRVFSFRVLYSYKSREIYSFSTSLNNDYCILIKTTNTSKYVDVTEKFPKFLQEKISEGYGCDRKKGKPCRKGCVGFRFPFDDSILDISKYLKIWLDSELSSMRKIQK